MSAVVASSFESVLADVQAELVAVSLDYAGEAPSDAFIYCSLEEHFLVFNVFFIVNGQVVKKHKVPDADTSFDQQDRLLDYGQAQLQRLVDAGAEFGRSVPTEIKMHYVVASRSLDADYKYDLQYTNDDSLHSSDIFQRWQDEVSAAL